MNTWNSMKLLSFGIIFIFLITGFTSSAFVIDDVGDSDYLFDQIAFCCYDGSDLLKYDLYLQQIQNGSDEGGMNNLLMDDNKNGIIYSKNDILNSLFGPMDSAWPMICHDNKHSGRSPYSTIDNNGAELWKFHTSNFIEGSAVVDNNGIIYFGSFNNLLYALYPNGTLKWKFDTGGWIWSTPAIGEDGTIYVGSWDNYLYALNPDGTLKWRFNVRDDISSSPAIASDSTIYFGIMGPDDNGRVFAISPDGTEKWHYDTDYWITSDPAIGDDGTIYIGSGDTYLYAIYPNGTLRWKFDTGHYIKGPASIADDGTIYFGSYDDYLYALYPDGNMKWKIKTGSGTETNPSIGQDGTIYVGDDKLYAINPDGSYKWKFDLGINRRIHQSSPAISADGIIYIGTKIGDSSGGEIIAVNSDGTERWRRSIATYWVESSPIIDKNGIVYVGSSSGIDGDYYGYLYAFGPGDVNNPPNKPIITGPNTGKYGETYSYSISATDPDNDDFSYFIDWGDGSNSGWIGPYVSGTEITESHSWSSDGTYIIKVKARDTEGSESNWASLEVTMPKNKINRLFYFFDFIRQLFDRFDVS